MRLVIRIRQLGTLKYVPTTFRCSPMVGVYPLNDPQIRALFQRGIHSVQLALLLARGMKFRFKGHDPRLRECVAVHRVSLQMEICKGLIFNYSHTQQLSRCDSQLFHHRVMTYITSWTESIGQDAVNWVYLTRESEQLYQAYPPGDGVLTVAHSSRWLPYFASHSTSPIQVPSLPLCKVARPLRLAFATCLTKCPPSSVPPRQHSSLAMELNAVLHVGKCQECVHFGFHILIPGNRAKFLCAASAYSEAITKPLRDEVDKLNKEALIAPRSLKELQDALQSMLHR